MTKRFYVKGAEAVLNGDIDFVGDTIKVSLLKNTYTPNYSSDDFYNDLSAHVAATVTLASKSATGGAFDAGNVTFPAVTAGDTCDAIVIWRDSGDPATSEVLIYIDDVDITNFPVLTSGADVSVTWSDTATRIFSLVP